MRFARYWLLLWLIALACPLRGAPAEASRPNVIVILLDDFGWSDLACYGSKYYQTPNIDRLAAGGMRFTDAYAACPVCSPTRAALMTGKYPARLHLTDWLPGRPDMPSQKLLRPALRQELPLEEMTIAELLRDAGYATACIGKWHLGGAGYEPTRQGFEMAIPANGAGSPASYFAPYRTRQGKDVPGLEQAAPGEYLTDRLTDEAIKFIDRKHEQPFFLYLAHFAVHIPLKAKESLVDKYTALVKPGPQQNAIYAAMIESVDQGVGRILARLAELKLDERTIVLFSSDNGGLATLEGPNTPATSNAPLREGKGFLYEGGTRAPLIVRWPGHISPGSTCATPVSTIDFLPTLLEACGIANQPAVDGVSLLPLLTASGQLDREALYWHYPHYSNQGGHPGGAIRAGDYKLIEFYENGRRELYNVRSDIRETKNLAAEMPERVQALATKLADWRTSVAAQMTRPNPDYVPNPQAADGVITLPAKTAEVHGTMVRYEPIPQKNTLGFWTKADDWVSWEFQLNQPGTFTLEALVGCGNGSGGSEVKFSLAGHVLSMMVEETGGFQKFVPRELGTVKLDKPGRYTLSVKPRTKPKAAVMDLRQVTLRPTK